MSEVREARPASSYWVLFAILAAGGLLYVKWLPYVAKALTAMSSHTLGPSILTGGAARAPSPSWAAAWAYAFAYGKAVWKAMVLGLLLGAGVQALLPADWVRRMLGVRSPRATLMGALLALPSMMCTCCAAPIVVGLRRREATTGSAVAYWLGNSVLNPATLVFVGFVLGWRWAALRLGLGLVMVLGLGFFADRPTTGRQAGETDRLLAESDPDQGAMPEGPLVRFCRVLAGMTLRLVPEYVVLVLVLGAARTWLFPHLGPQVGDSLPWILAFAVAGAVFVVPTAGEVPIIQAMLALGVGAGPLGALLMTLPPISLPSVLMLWRAFPARVLAVVSGAVVLSGLAGGMLAKAFHF